MAAQEIERIEIELSDSWEKHQCGEDSFFTPKFMVALIQDVSPKSCRCSGLPFINILENDKGMILEMELSPGLVRAVPIFYAVSDRVLYVSDIPQSIKNKLRLDELDELSMLELLSLGYVGSNRTLIKELYSVQAGDALFFKAGEMRIETEYLYDNLPIEDRSYNELRDELREVVEVIFDQVAICLKGKAPVIPLSGGYDSRLIVSMLKLNNVKNVICLSYGIPGNCETEVSKEVAKRVGYEWHYIPYTFEKWTGIFHKELFVKYLDFSNRYVSLPHYQELPLLMEINKRFRGSEIAFIPGHSADFTAGSHITPNCFLAKDIDSLVNSIVERHYEFRLPPMNENVRNAIYEQFKEYLRAENYLFRVFEKWDWRERQAKFITNANRLYEFFGYHWAMPFWDKRFTDFWSKVPLNWKYAQRLYDKFLEEEIFSKLHIDFDRGIRRKRRIEKRRGIRKAVLALKHKGLYACMKRIRNLLKPGGTASLEQNTYGFDIANPILLDIASSWSEFSFVDSYCKREFRNRGVDPNSYVSEFLLTYLLSTKEISLRKSNEPCL